MAELGLILGPTGTGKSFGTKTLDPKSTVIINVNETKRLPYQGSSKLYNAENKNWFVTADPKKIISTLEWASKQAHINCVVIDDSRYVMEREYLAKALEQGYTKYTVIGQNFQKIVDTCATLRHDMVVFMVLHDEDVKNENVIVGKKVKTVGQLVDNHFNPLELVNIVLYTECVIGKEKNVYQMHTQKALQGTIELPSKSPEGMFKDKIIPNDYEAVRKIISEYY